MYLDIVNYYISNNSHVNRCLLDACKAFDKAHVGKLFKLLLKRNIPYIIVRFLLKIILVQKVSCDS